MRKDDGETKDKGKGEEPEVSDQTKVSAFDAIPTDVKRLLLSMLDTKSLKATAKVNKELNKLSKEELAKRHTVFVVVPNFYNANAPLNQDLFKRLDLLKDSRNAFFTTPEEAQEYLFTLTLSYKTVSAIVEAEIPQLPQKDEKYLTINPKDITAAHVYKSKPGSKGAWEDVFPDQGKTSEEKLSAMIKLIEDITIKGLWKTNTKMQNVVISGNKVKMPADVYQIYHEATATDLAAYKKLNAILELCEKLESKPQAGSLLKMFKRQTADQKSEQDVAEELKNIGSEKSSPSKTPPR